MTEEGLKYEVNNKTSEPGRVWEQEPEAVGADRDSKLICEAVEGEAFEPTEDTVNGGMPDAEEKAHSGEASEPTDEETDEKWETLAPAGDIELPENVYEDTELLRLIEKDAAVSGPEDDADERFTTGYFIHMAEEISENMSRSEDGPVQAEGEHRAEEENESRAKGLSSAGPVPARQEYSPEDKIIIEKIRARKRASAARRRRTRRRFRLIVITALLAVSGFIFSFSSLFTVDLIEVRGNSHYSGEEIINIGHASAGNNIFYHSGRNEIEDYLEDNPYIESAKVKRRLPSTLVIEVSERKEAFCMKYDDDYLVADRKGILLRKSKTEPKLTGITGLVATRIKPGEKLGVKSDKLLDAALELLASMRKSDLYFVRIDLSKTDENTGTGEVRAYIYESLMVKTDTDILKANLDNGRLHKVVESLFSEGISRGTIVFRDDGNASFEPGL